MNKSQFLEQAEEISRQAEVIDGLHNYFRSSADRLYRSCELFNLFTRPLGDVLEIGPFYGYTPFILSKKALSYTILEGDDPAAYPLKPLYEKASIEASFVDFFDIFGPTHDATHSLTLKENAYDTILCWETMEHFNFNPVKFVRELHRVLKPRGQVCITVPNRASYQNLSTLFFGRNEETMIQSYFRFEDYESNGKKAFYGFHWREYTPSELALLFRQAGFEIQVCQSFTVFQDHGQLSLGRRLARFLSKLGSQFFNRFGTNVYLIATKS